ncbi:class I adenylate-forming enzyme family protein [Parvibaculum sp.]|uniref:class I adenylate-forming enzyme family protein n=1 Tax=Parvibaculum sp. TaxID=2024848 RepID=UPI003C73796D
MIHNAFEKTAEKYPTGIHLILEDGVFVEYRETISRSLKLANWLRDRGIRTGDRVVALLGNGRELYELYLACSYLNAIAVPVNTQLAPRECADLIADCSPAGIVAEALFCEKVPSAQIDNSIAVKLVTRGSFPGWEPFEEALAEASEEAIATNASGTSAALILYTSGTTGRPKGIVLSHQALLRNATKCRAILQIGHEDRLLAMLPGFASFGVSVEFLQTGLAGATTIILRKFEALEAARLIERYKVTFLAGVPTMFSRLFEPDISAHHNMKSLRLIDVGGGPVSLQLKHDLRHLHGIETVESYGLTEISPTASIQRPGEQNPEGSCGKPLDGFKVEARNPKGKPVAPGKPGELFFKANTLMLGYWRQIETTKETINGGWLRTGDIGKVDKRGNIYILDRAKDMIVTNGFNVYPKEIENVIDELDDVLLTAAIGVPDEISGEKICAFVQTNGPSDLTEESVIKHCKQRLAPFKVPRCIFFVTDLPLTASGKIRRVVLRNDAAARLKAEKTESIRQKLKPVAR